MVSINAFKQQPEEEWVEIVNGNLVNKLFLPSYRRSCIITNLYDMLNSSVKNGEVFPFGLSYLLSIRDDTVYNSRIPDVSFIRREHIPLEFDYESGFPGAPDLAIEVISLSEGAEYTQEKISDYLAAGTEQVWVLYPTRKVIHVYSRDTPDTVKIYHADDILEAPTLFPGLQIKVADLFVIES